MKNLLFIVLIIITFSCNNTSKNNSQEITCESIDIFLYNEDCNGAHPNPLLLSSYSINIKITNSYNNSILLDFDLPIARVVNNKGIATDLEVFKKNNITVIFEEKKNNFSIPSNSNINLHLRDVNSTRFNFNDFEKDILRKDILNSNLVFNNVNSKKMTPFPNVLRIPENIKIRYYIDDLPVNRNDTIKFCKVSKHPPASASL
ncbi:hypothetical protein ULMS_08790 [Patiriisocius marinistellae]|uniref:Uncharacterized protein n=1 Tax=Patiriisocius marinistellae TaxID=2494560 RepID=A0A5J4G036_9FLAO|nr:hypothetical protein [Patiriisocius marinistellae]GEQ85371.1 hypothetical protein ULMS_08790 [Patiriisocius marinistellae]